MPAAALPSACRPLARTFGAVACLAALVAALAAEPADAGRAHARAATELPRLRWAPPRLTAPTVVQLSRADRGVQLDPGRDYVVRLPARPLRVTGGVTISGGRNVVLIGGEIQIPRQGPHPGPNDRRALFLMGQTGTVHVEGIRIGGDVGDAIDLQEPDATAVQLENVHVDGVAARDRVHFTDTHPDLVQTWAGPRALRIDGFTGTTTYQGFFLDPNEQAGRTAPRELSFRRVDLHGTPTAGYLLWLGRRCNAAVASCGALTRPPVSLTDVWVDPNPTKPTADQALWQDPAPWRPTSQPQPRSVAPAESSWARARFGSPAAGSFVPAGAVGVGYRTPGYAATSARVR